MPGQPPAELLTMTPSYEQAPYPVREDLPASHRRFWRRLAAPGSWWTGPERVAIARETRAARECALCGRRREALSPYHLAGTHDRSTAAGVDSLDVLPEVAVDAVHRIVTDASRLKRAWLDQAIADGLTVERYVELLGTVVALVSIDSFCRALGVAEHPLPEPEPGEPTRYRPPTARQEEAWVPVVPDDNAGTAEADLWPAGQNAWVIRAMSLVPDEVRTLNDLGAAHYLPLADVRNPKASRGRLSRPQIELVAGRVSALNHCFY